MRVKLKRHFDTIRLENVRSEISAYNYVLLADVFVNGKLFSGFCDLNTFLKDTHEKNVYLDRPRANNRAFVPYKLVKEKIAGLELEDLKSLKSYQRSAAKKRNLKKMRKAVFDEAYQKRGAMLNFHIQHKEKLSLSFLDSCSCGIPECSGISNGVTICKKKYGIVYTATNIYPGYNKGILGSGKMSIYVRHDNIEQLRKKINEENKKAEKLFLEYKDAEEMEAKDYQEE